MVAMALAVLLAMLAVSCGGAGKKQESPLSREQLAARAVDQAETSGQTVFPIRYNPPACPCPPFEVEVAERWVRVFLQDDDPEAGVAQALERAARQAESASLLPLFYALGTPEPDRFKPCSTGFPVMEFSIESFSDRPPVEPAVPGDEEGSATPAAPPAP
jgi:hypothetical protein